VEPLSRFGRTVTELRSDGRGAILAAIAAGWFLSLGVRMVYPALLPHIRVAYGLDLTTAGLLLTVLWVAYALGQLPGGVLADRIGEGAVMTASTLVSAGMLTLAVTADSAAMLFLATALFGLATALYGIARFTALSDLYPENDGAAIGVTMGAGDMGNAVLPPVAGFLAAAFAWQYGLGFTIPVFLASTVALWAVVPARTSGATSAVDSLSLDAVRYVVSIVLQPTIVTVVSVQILLYWVFQAFIGFYPTYLIEVKGLPSTLATGLYGLFFGLGVLVKPLSGSAYDRFGVRRPLRAIVVTITLALALLPFVDRLSLLVALTVPLSLLLGYGAITLPYMTATLPEDAQSTGLGVLRATYMTIGAMSPVVFGAVAERGFFDEGFVALAAIAGVALLLSVRVPLD
jgi:MFS family permease